MFVKDILPDLEQAIGSCQNDYAFRRLTDAVKLLANKKLINPSMGEIAVCVCGNFVTLPAEVLTPLGISVNSCPAIMRDQWFTFHISGPGDKGYTPFDFADVLGHDFPTIREPAGPVKLAARIYAPSDQNKLLRVFGWDGDGNRIFTTGADGSKEDGLIVPTVWNRTLINSEAPAIVKIDRVAKEVMADMVELFAIDPDSLEATSLLGRYRPRETTPAYMRIRVPEQNVVRVKYRRRVFDVKDQYDWIPVESREGLIHAIRAVKYRLDGKYATAREAESEALRIVAEEEQASRPGGIKPPQVIHNEMPRETAGSSLFYGGRTGWPGYR